MRIEYDTYLPGLSTPSNAEPAPSLYEAHVTIEPVFDERFDDFTAICTRHNFRPAELLLKKSRAETAVRSNKDSFCTGHGQSYNELRYRLTDLVTDLKLHAFQVWRYKIEGILLDVRNTQLFTIGDKL